MRFKLTQRRKTKIIFSTLLTAGVIMTLLITSFIIDVVYADKFYPGVKMAGVDISKLNKDQAQKIFQAKIQQLNTQGQKFFYQTKYITLYPTTLSATDPDLIYEIVTFNLNQSLEQASQFVRGKNFFENI